MTNHLYKLKTFQGFIYIVPNVKTARIFAKYKGLPYGTRIIKENLKTGKITAFNL